MILISCRDQTGGGGGDDDEGLLMSRRCGSNLLAMNHGSCLRTNLCAIY